MKLVRWAIRKRCEKTRDKTTCLHNNQIASDSHYNNGMTTKTIPVFICFSCSWSLLHFRELDKTSKTRYDRFAALLNDPTTSALCNDSTGNSTSNSRRCCYLLDFESHHNKAGVDFLEPLNECMDLSPEVKARIMCRSMA